MRRVLFLCDKSLLPLYAIRALAPNIYQAYVLGSKHLEFRYSRFCHRYFIADQGEIESGSDSLVGKINKITSQYKIDCVVPIDLRSNLGLSKIKSKLLAPVFPVTELATIEMFANKWLTAQFATKHDIAHPRTEFITSPEQLLTTDFPKPFLIKPTSLSGRKGIVKINHHQQIKQYLKRPSRYKIFPFIIQEYIPGEDLDVSLLADKGKLITWVAQRWDSAKALHLFYHQPAISLAKKIVEWSNFSGLMHIDLRLNQQTQQLFLLECNPRCWGSITAPLLSGINFIELGIQLADGKQPQPVMISPATYHRPNAVLAMIFKNPLGYHQLSLASRTYFWRVITDPLPYLVLLLNKLKNHHWAD